MVDDEIKAVEIKAVEFDRVENVIECKIFYSLNGMAIGLEKNKRMMLSAIKSLLF
jgi:hypothetical protein